MKTIHKYTIGVGLNSVEMPKDARVLDVGAQGDHIRLWALVDTKHLDELRHFRVYGTGTELAEDFTEENLMMGVYGERYIGTALCGEFVWHVFELRA